MITNWNEFDSINENLAKARSVLKKGFDEFRISELNHYQELSELKKNINDIVYYEFGDAGVEYEIKPDNEIGVKVLSLKQRGLLDERGDEFAPFYVNIYTTNLKDEVDRSGALHLPVWFIEVINRVEDYILSEGYDMIISVRLPGRWVDVKSVDDLSKLKWYVSTIRLK